MRGDGRSGQDRERTGDMRTVAPASKQEAALATMTNETPSYLVGAERDSPPVLAGMEATRLTDIRPGAFLRYNGNDAEVLLVAQGLLAILRDVGARRASGVGLLGAGELIDLAAAQGAGHDSAVRYRALGPVRVLHVPATTFHRLPRDHADLRAAWLRQLPMLEDARMIAACNARHGLPERVAHWLLWLRHRLGGDMLPVTHACLAELLGVRRAGVTVALHALQRQGLLVQHRGGLTIADAVALERHACSCCAAVQSAIPMQRLPVNPAEWSAAIRLDSPRVRLAAALRQGDSMERERYPACARRAAALRLCQSIITETEGLLAA
jgi:CRP-like cAMP-binding protein